MFLMCIAFGIITESVFSVNAQATDIRLGNVTGLELKPYEGPIEVFIDGDWGSISPGGVDNVTAKTVCKILGYGYIGFRVEKFQYAGRRRLLRLKCVGHETSILECQQEAGSLLGTFDVAGVHCFDHVFTEVRLSGGKKVTEGMVQVKMDGRWGSVCDFDKAFIKIPAPNVSLAICRTLGFQNYDLQNGVKGVEYDGVELSWIDVNYVSCTGEETHFNQCTFQDVTIYQPRCYAKLIISCISTLSQNCSSDDICAGVDNAFCSNNECACKEGYIQTGPRQCSAAFTFRLFKTSELFDEGLVEVYTSGNWSLVSGRHLTFNDATAKVLCQTLGFGFVGFSTWMYYYSGLNYTGYLAYKVFQCDGSPPDATECFDNIWYEMGLSDGTPVTRLHCYDSRINDIRLEGGLVPHEGRLEVRIGEKWGTVCYTYYRFGEGFSSEDEVCRLLGYTERGTLHTTWNSNENLEVWLTNLYCDTNVSDINNCSYDLSDALGGCFHQNIELGLYCSPLRLVDGPSENSGRIEAGFHGKMYTICSDDFSLAVANVSCRLLGYSDVVDLSVIPESFDGNIPMLNSSVECSGTESSLEYCNISISTDFTCHSGSVAGVTCLSPLGSPCQLDETCAGVMHSTCENFRCTCKRGYMSSGDRNCTAKYTFRFTQETSNEGLIEVNINNTWALVTGSFVPFSDQTSKALCATLGYGYTGFSTVTIPDSNLSYIGYVWNNMIECTGMESYATECIVGTWKAEQQTRSLYLTRLHCFEFLVTGLRLQGGVLPNEGRFEVKVDGRWGTVCVNARAGGSVSEDDLCRLLGYVKESLDSPSMTTEHFDDTEEVWMSYPRCNSTNTDINGCSKIKGVSQECNVHTYDMYMKCDPVRIVDGAWQNSGRIEAGIRGYLQSFCETGIDMEVANITCNILGYNGAKTLSSGGSNGSSVYSGRVECKGTETSLENCSFIDDTNIDCKESGVAYITCQGGPAKIIPFDKKPYEGVFVHYYMNEWRHIGTAISDITAKTLCNILGFGSEGYAVMIYGEVDGGTDIFESMVCKGNESEVAECVSGLYKQQTCYDNRCYHPTFGAVALYCADYEIDSIRLVNGLSNSEGVVQVLVDGVWGYVCATEWNITDTNIACKTRGFTSGLGYRSVQSQNATVLIGHLQCTGSESHLNQCTYKKKGHYDHSESCSDYVYVACTSECRQRFYGDQCLPCECNAANTKSCDIVSGECFCVDGWTGNSCSDDIDECATISIVCPTNKNCVNSPGSYTCECELGFMETGDICTECSAGNYGRNCSSTCSCNTDRSRESLDGRKCDKVTGECECKMAWSGITCENDVDECLNSTICQSQNTQCKNTVGGYECVCLQGYERQDLDGCIPVDSSTDTMMLVIILSSVVSGLTLVAILFFICFRQYRRKTKGAADTNDNPVKENRFNNHNVIATSIRSTVREEVYDTIVDKSDTIDVNAFRVTKNKDDGYLDIVLVNRNELAQTYEKGVVRNQINEYLDLNAVEQDTQDEYDYVYEGNKLSEKGYVDVSGVRRKLPEIPKNSSTTGKEGAKDPYSELKHKKLPDHMYERMADEPGYLKPVGLGNGKPDDHGYLKPVGLGNVKPDEHEYLKPVGLGNGKPDEHEYLKPVGLGNVKPGEPGYLEPVGLGNGKPVEP